MIEDYTTPDEVRAVLGVSDEDLEDSVFALPFFENYLTMEFEEVSLDLQSTYATIKALPAPTAAETRFLQAASMFATFALAKQLTTSLPLFATKQVTDSKASLSRFDNPYKDVIAAIAREYDRARNRVAQALGAVIAVTGTGTPLRFMSVVSPAIDPVTNT